MTGSQTLFTEKTRLPRLANPAQRALAATGITCLEDLTKYREEDIRRLHGIGPNALKLLHQAMNEKGLSFSVKKTGE
jgi:hypothetical protein